MDQKQRDQACVNTAKESLRDFQEGRNTYDEAKSDIQFFGTQCHGRNRKHRIYKMLWDLET